LVANLLGAEERDRWEAYAVENQDFAGIEGNTFHKRSIQDGIFRVDEKAGDEEVSWGLNPNLAGVA
jgi:hypothetical protein